MKIINLKTKNWEIVKLGDIVTFQRGFDLPKSNFKNGNYPVIGSNGIIGQHNKFKAKGPGITIGRSGNLGEPYYIENDYWPHNTTLFSIKFHNSYPRFIYYLLKRMKLNRFNAGSAVPTLNRNHIHPIKVIAPKDIAEQERISDILSSLDKKIEINNKINVILEKIAQLLFKHWFIDFEFPNEQGQPYKSSGGEFIDSELRKIPKGWKICKLLDCGKIICGKTPPKSNKNYFGGNVPFIKIPDMHNNVFILKTVDSLTEKGKKFQENKTIPAKSIIVSCIATVGLISITSSESQTNQQINSLIPFYEPNLYYIYFKLKTLKDYFNTLGSSGSATLNINTKIFSNIKVIMPTNNILEKFNKIVSPIFNSILLNSRENLKLSQIRDSLLPKLITGKIRINLDDIKES